MDDVALARFDDGHTAWSSPIWISVLPDAAPMRDKLHWLPEERGFLWGASVEAIETDPLPLGGEHHVEPSTATAEHRIRASFTDPVGNRRHIERGAWLERNARPPFLHHTHSS